LSPGEAIGDDSMPMTVDVRSDAAVYAAHAPEMVRFATGLVGPSDAPDVVADAFVRLSAAPVWDAALDRRALWYRAVLFEARSFQRSTARRRDREVRVAVGSSSTSVEAEPVDPAVWQALDALSPQQRAVVFLSYWDDLDPAAVARLLDVSEGAVRKQLARAREKLRKVLA
jgi:RNA polymerase sigma factor (sigma-70 family)